LYGIPGIGFGRNALYAMAMRRNRMTGAPAMREGEKAIIFVDGQGSECLSRYARLGR